jgi:hypothetical protein
LKDSLSTKDSFNAAFFGKHVLKSFGEPNLSIKPAEKITFRFIYESWYKQTIISITEDKIQVKEGTKGVPYSISHDTSKLNDLETFHLHILTRRFPFSETRLESAALRHVLDSIALVYPELNQPGYYRHLLDKSAEISEEKFEFSVKSIPITYKTFAHIADLINSSGFWSLPFKLRCKNILTDAGGFILEANTPQKYKVIMSGDCPDNRTKLNIACQELIKYAGMEKKIQLMWDGSVVSDSVNF